jgi:hypothetical protein
MKPSNENKDNPNFKSLNIDSTKIMEDEAGNCVIDGKRIEKNACSLIKDNYKKR